MKLLFALQDGTTTRESNLELSALPAAVERGGKLEIQNSGASFTVDWAIVAPGTYSILVNGRSYDVRLEKSRGSNAPSYVAHVGGRTYQLEMRDPRRARKSGAAGAHDGPMDIVAPMPGRIVKVLVAAGAETKTGDSLLVIEAMKMQNEIRAPRSGRVEAICVKEGEGVESGAPLLRLA
ncbi:MAG: biotin/lipoyl-containing protein [Deltaproteobacteria bacterium]